MPIRWKKEISPTIIKALDENPKWRFPTIRSVYYYLSDALNLIPGTEYAYKKLDSLIVDMRKSGMIPFGRFSVVRGVDGSNGGFAIDEEWLIEQKIEEILELSEGVELPYLYGQPFLFEVWVEKKGLLPTFEELTKSWDVKVRSPEGFTPWEFGHRSTKDIEEYYEQRLSEKVIILYFGDQDPSGIQIYESLMDQLNFFGLECEINRVGVTLDQIKEYKLPDSPKDKETLEKIDRDSRLPKYLKNYGEIFCELDSFISLAPNEFEEVLKNEIESLIDEKALDVRDESNMKLKEKWKKIINSNREKIEGLKEILLEEWKYT